MFLMYSLQKISEQKNPQNQRHYTIKNLIFK